MPNTGALLRTALRLCRRRSDAEDLVQETMLQAWRAFDQFQMGTNCKAWLFTIMINLFYRQSRKKANEPIVHGYEEPLPDLFEDGETSMIAREVLAAVTRLPEEQRTVLMLVTVEGFTTNEVSQMLRIPIGTANSRLARARAALRQELGLEKAPVRA